MKSNRKQASILTLRALLQRPHKRQELDTLLGWLNSPQQINELRHQGFGIVTTLDSDRRAIYALPFSEKQTAYQYIEKRNKS